MNPSQFSLHYITRVFNASLDKLEKFQHKIEPSKIDLSRIRNSKHILGLVLTYYINYGLSLRKTALILYEIHDIKISHQTIANYAQAASHLLFHGWTTISIISTHINVAMKPMLKF
ncbi:hypothetical protein [Longibaculum muris]|uniref:hypothetical protein n=1 Tax=Longibaculum muris TaxID=1796628 RepID=UPI0022E1DBB5|nr:hypothetical protein [Longibaculum muris]